MNLCFSQDNLWITIHGGYNYNQFKPGLLNDFISSYNSAYSSFIKTPFDKFDESMAGLNFGGGMFLQMEKLTLGFDFSKVKYRQERSTQFNNLNGRQVSLQFVNWDMNIDIGGKLLKTGSVGFLMGVTYRSAAIYSKSFSYGESNMSYGSEYWLNGIYRGTPQTDLNVGALIRIPIFKYGMIQFTAYYPLPFADGNPDEQYLSAFSDDSPGKNICSQYFPKDVAQFDANCSAGIYDYQNNVIPNKFRGPYLNASLVFRINLLNEKK